jgi:hypothetical protein
MSGRTARTRTTRDLHQGRSLESWCRVALQAVRLDLVWEQPSDRNIGHGMARSNRGAFSYSALRNE